MNHAQTPVAAAVAAQAAPAASDAPAQPVSLLTDAQARAVVGAAVDLSNADKQFANSVQEVARAVAIVLGTAPTFDLWTEVQDRFTTRYQEARECSPETARQRWVKVVAEFAIDKPRKPTKAAEVKQAQRTEAADEAAKIIAAAKATTPAAILGLMAPTDDGEPVKKAVADALAAEAKRIASEANKAANEAARAEVKALREEIRKGLADCSLATLRAIRALMPATVPDETEVDGAEAPGEVAGSTRASEEVRAG